ncbi:MAG: hypothetical protein JNL70_05065 [Saprospiraceae bacterium]|nr:hypothetical protein [Saprospiraceae bacterium]
MNYKILIFAIALLFDKSRAIAQSAETYAGHKRIGVDLMWFKNFKNTKEERTPFLFFSRNRASTDYKNTPTAFGSTNAVSYNFKNGLGIVVVASFVNTGFISKSGVQLVKTKGDFLYFGWLVADLKKGGSVDLFGLFRYQPKINEKWRAFGQLELFPVYNLTSEIWNITQRLRLGAKYHTWAGGFMADFNQSGKDNFTKTNNLGGFWRYEF